MKFIGLPKKNIAGPAPQGQPNVEFVNLARISLVQIKKNESSDAKDDELFTLRLMADQNKEIYHMNFKTYQEAYEMAKKILGGNPSIIDCQYF